MSALENKDNSVADDHTKEVIQTYDYDTLIGLNHPDLSSLDLKLVTFFNSLPVYPITKEIRFYYPNKFNMHFNKNRIRPKSVISNDPMITKKIKSTLSKVSHQNIEKMTIQLEDLLSQQDDFDWTDIAELFYASIVDNILMVELFVKILKKLEEKYPKLVHHVHHLILKQLYHPRLFKDSLSESGASKAKRWQIANGVLIAQIYHQKSYSKAFLVRILNLWLSEASPDNLIPLEILVKVLPVLEGVRLDKSIRDKLLQLSKEKAYPSRLRLLLNLPSPRNHKN